MREQSVAENLGSVIQLLINVLVRVSCMATKRNLQSKVQRSPIQATQKYV